jgi:hypothetical protein
MSDKLLNTFLLGADPEVVVLDPPTLVNGQKSIKNALSDAHFFGWDHNGFVLEPHPAPCFSARGLMANMKKSLDVISHRLPSYRLRAGAHYSDPDTRSVTLGGHVHLDIPILTRNQIDAMDVLTESLEHLDILPKNECLTRFRAGTYGRKSDIRAERGRVEYRSMCSWLFSRKTSMLCVTGIKLAAVAPQTLKKMTSISELKGWIEGFKGTDDDADWILDRGYFDSSMEARPDANVKSVWKVDPGNAEGLLKSIQAVKVDPPWAIPREDAPEQGVLTISQIRLLRQRNENGQLLTLNSRIMLERTIATSVMEQKRLSARNLLEADRNLERQQTTRLTNELNDTDWI